MPTRFWSLVAIVTFTLTHAWSFAQSWGETGASFSKVSSNRVFSTPESMGRKQWNLSFKGTRLGDFTITTKRVSVELLQKLELRVTPGSLGAMAGFKSSLQATGDMTYDLFNNLTCGDIRWIAGSEEGRIFLRRQVGQLEIVVITPTSHQTHKIPWENAGVAGADPFTALSLPALREGESWPLNIVHPVTGSHEPIVAKALRFDTARQAWRVEIQRDGLAVATAYVAPSGTLVSVECLGFEALLAPELRE